MSTCFFHFRQEKKQGHNCNPINSTIGYFMHHYNFDYKMYKCYKNDA